MGVTSSATSTVKPGGTSPAATGLSAGTALAPGASQDEFFKGLSDELADKGVVISTLDKLANFLFFLWTSKEIFLNNNKMYFIEKMLKRTKLLKSSLNL